MAVPTLTACSPSVIFTGGQLVTLTGTNFRLPYPLPDVDGPLPVPPPTVSVKVNGTEAEQVQVLSATSLTCLVGANDPTDEVSIEVQNLDVDGESIPGEVVTEEGLLEFARADLTRQADGDRVTQQLMRLLIQQVIPNVIKSVETDYSSDPEATVFGIPDVATLPCVVVSGPRERWSPIYDEKAPERSDGDGAVARTRLIKTVDLTYAVSVYDDHEGRIQNLRVLMSQVMLKNPWLKLARDPEDASKGIVKYELEGGDWNVEGAPSLSNVKMFSGEVVVKGFQYEDIAGFPGESVREKAQTVDNIVTQEAPFSGAAS